MNLGGLLASARTCGFADLDSIRRLARAAVILSPDGQHLAPSAMGTRLGGRPALPASVAWPRWNGQSLAFVAQIELGALPVQAELGLPREGRLLFFYDAEQRTWGFDPADAGSFAVLHDAEPAPTRSLTPWPEDLPALGRYSAWQLGTETGLTLPDWGSELIDELHLTRGQLGAYQALLEAVSGEGDVRSRRGLLGGHPHQIQDDMTLECAMVAAGLDRGTPASFQDPRMPLFHEQAHEWRLLLQVPSVEAAGMMWGDVGCLYYWIRAADLSARRFDRSWMILQCG